MFVICRSLTRQNVHPFPAQKCDPFKYSKYEIVLTVLEGFSENIVKCKNERCANAPLVTDDSVGEVFCSSCGQVVIERVEDAGADQHTFTMEDYIQNTRTCPKTSLAINDMGLSTVINPNDKDASGNSLSSELKSTFNRLRMWDNRSKARSSDRTMRKAFMILDDIKTKLGIPERVSENAAYIFRKALAKKLTRGRFVSVMMLASIYLACREGNTPRSLHDIASAANINQKVLFRHVRILTEELEIKTDTHNSSDFLGKIAASTGAKETTKRIAYDILAKARDIGFSEGKKPVAMAASALYMSSKINHDKSTQKAISEASGISSVTIRNLSRLLVKRLELGSLGASSFV